MRNEYELGRSTPERMQQRNAREVERARLADSFPKDVTDKYGRPTFSTERYVKLVDALWAFDAETKRLFIENVKKSKAKKKRRRENVVRVRQGLEEIHEEDEERQRETRNDVIRWRTQRVAKVVSTYRSNNNKRRKRSRDA